MKLCVFSDIHGNIDAFNKMIEIEKNNVDGYIFLGDIFGYFYNQSEIIDKLRSIKNIWAVRGNHDENYMQMMNEGKSIKKELIDKYGSSYSILLNSKQKKYLEQLPNCLEVEIDGKICGIYHGGILDYTNQRIYPDTKLDLPIDKYDILLLGHTHYRLVRRYGESLVINPGSLGQPRDGKGFSYVILDLYNKSYEFKTVNVDIIKLINMMENLDSDKTVFNYIKKKYEGT
jgi:putative phosphoesterase